MRKRHGYILVAVVGLWLLASSAVWADGTPDLRISTREKGWKESEVIRTRGSTQAMYLQLKNEPDSDGDTNSHTFTLDGPSDGSGWSVTYHLSGTEKSVPFDVELEEGEKTTVRVSATPLAYPETFLWATKNKGTPFSLTGNGSVDRAGAAIIVPGDLRIRNLNEAVWTGGDTVLDPKVDIWGSGQEAPVNSAATEGASIYHVELHNVQNATVSYRLRVQAAASSAASLQVCWATNSSWEATADITSAVKSETAYGTGYLSPGEVRRYKLYVVPVGNDTAARSVAFSAAVDDIDGLSGLNEMTDLVPITACLDSLPPEGDSFNLYGPPNAGTLTPGNFGLLDYDGGSNPVGEVEDWMESRHDLTVPDDRDHVWIYGSPGYKSALKDEFSALVGKTLNVPICTESTDTGAGTQFKMKGYAQVVLTSFSHGSPATANFEWVSFFHMPMLTEAVICNTGRAPGLETGPWKEINSVQYEQQ